MIQGHQEKKTEQDMDQEPSLLHGGDLYGAARQSGRAAGELLDFSANINPLGIPPRVRQAILDHMEQTQRYPDPLCRRLVQAIASKEGLDAGQILCGSGGADLIYRFAYARRPGKALLPAPTFAEYEEALGQVGTKLMFHALGENMQVGEAFVEALEPGTKAVFLCNPNNPTGLLTERSLIVKLLEKARTLGTTVFLDECFLDFVEGEEKITCKGYLEEFPNLIILKSFTKMYAIPGLRLGYVLSGNRKLLEAMRRAGQPWAVGGLAQEAGVAALEDPDFPVRTRQAVDREREFLREELSKLGLLVYEGTANYLCFRAPGETRLYEKLLQEGVILRRCANYRGLDPEHYRAAVRNREENRRFLQAIATVLADKNIEEMEQ